MPIIGYNGSGDIVSMVMFTIKNMQAEDYYVAYIKAFAKVADLLENFIDNIEWYIISIKFKFLWNRYFKWNLQSINVSINLP